MNWIANDRYKVLTSLSGGNMSKVFLCLDYGSKEKQEVVKPLLFLCLLILQVSLIIAYYVIIFNYIHVSLKGM